MVQELTAADGGSFDAFGNAVSVSGEAAIVGAFRDLQWQGSAYIFRFDGRSWLQEQKLLLPGPDDADDDVYVEDDTTETADPADLDDMLGPEYDAPGSVDDDADEYDDAATDAAEPDLDE